MLAAVAMATAATQAFAAPQVATTSGPLTGVEQGVAVAFMGIPYAAPPVGDRRWREPAAPATWTAPRAADHFAANCPQPKLPIPGMVAKPASEDCLYLNVWAP